MKKTELHMNKRVSCVLLAAVVLLFAAGAFCGAAAAATTVYTEEDLKTAVETDNFDVILGSDISLRAPLNVEKTGTLDLAGHILNYNGDDSVIKVKSGSVHQLTITDSNQSTVRYFQVSDALNNLYTPWKFIGAKPSDATSENTIALKDISSYDENFGWALKIGANYKYRYVTVLGGIITGSNGHGVTVGNDSTFTLSGGSIIGNLERISGGVWVDPKGTFEMRGGYIAGNKTSLSGGGVVSAGTVIMSGGSIVGNCADGTGGGVDFEDGTFTMTGGKIVGNFAKMGGGGVQFDSGTFEVSGTPVIKGNSSFNGEENVRDNLNLDKLRYITLAGKLNDGADIRVTAVDTRPGDPFGQVKDGYTPVETDADYFHADGRLILAAVLDTTVSPVLLKWADAHPVTQDAEIQHGRITAVPESAASGRRVVLTITPDAGYMFKEGTLKVYKSNEPEQQIQTTKLADNKYTFTMPDYSVVVYAGFDDVILVTFDMQGHGTQVPSQTIISGSKVTVPETPSATGYKFCGWFTDPMCTSKWDFDTAVTEDMTLYANWDAKRCTINLDSNGADISRTKEIVATYGSSLHDPIENPWKDGYTFYGWISQNDKLVINNKGNYALNAPGYTDAQGRWILDSDDTITLRASWEPIEEFFYSDPTGHAEMKATLVQEHDENRVGILAADNVLWGVYFTADPGTVNDPESASGHKLEKIYSMYSMSAIPRSDNPVQITVWIQLSEGEDPYNVCLRHCTDGTWDSKAVSPSSVGPCPDKTLPYTHELVFKVSKFSPFALTYETPVKKSGGNSSQGTSVWLTETSTPTPTPTSTPTSTPTPEVPTVKPVTQQPTQAKSPAPFMGVLAGLGCAAVLFGLRRK